MNEKLPGASERLFYRPVTVSDAQAFFELSADPAVRRWLPHMARGRLEEIEEEIAELSAVWENDEADPTRKKCLLGVFRRGDGALAGHVELWKIHGEHLEVGCSVVGEYRGRGYAAEAVTAILQWGLPFLDEADPPCGMIAVAEHENTASHRLLSKLGFVIAQSDGAVAVFDYKGPVV